MFRYVTLCVVLLSSMARLAAAGDLTETRALNIDEILIGLDLIDHPGRSIPVKQRWRFATLDPYYPAAKEHDWEGSARRDVLEWYAGYEEDESVCAVRFVDEERRDYVLQTFPSADAATRAGYVITHHHPCGACSTLQDLAIYIETPDLTTPARACAMKLTAACSRRCFIRRIGFTPYCAEAWAANARHTRKHCKSICIREYGLLNVLRRDFSGASNNRPDGSLSPCLECDETMSAAGFKYAAGRTRRNSGLECAIERGEAEQRSVEHSLYFGDACESEP